MPEVGVPWIVVKIDFESLREGAQQPDCVRRISEIKVQVCINPNSRARTPLPPSMCLADQVSFQCLRRCEDSGPRAPRALVWLASVSPSLRYAVPWSGAQCRACCRSSLRDIRISACASLHALHAHVHFVGTSMRFACPIAAQLSFCMMSWCGSGCLRGMLCVPWTLLSVV